MKLPAQFRDARFVCSAVLVYVFVSLVDVSFFVSAAEKVQRKRNSDASLLLLGSAVVFAVVAFVAVVASVVIVVAALTSCWGAI